MSIADITKAETATVQDAEIILERTPEIVAAEICQIKDQTRKLVLNNSIEIGKRLCEAKEMVPHGEWGTWLERNVDYKQSTANKLMKIYEQYGAAQGELWSASVKSETFTNLTYSQALALLAVPAEEREEFVKENDVPNMSTRELQEAIKARDEALKEKDEAKEKALAAEEKLRKEMDAANERVRAAQRQAESVMEELDRVKSSGNSQEKVLLEKKLERANEELKREKEKAKAQRELHERTKNEASEVQKQFIAEINELKEKLAAAEEKPAVTLVEAAEIARLKEQLAKAEQLGAERLAADEDTARFKVLFQTVQNNFSDLMDAMACIRNDGIHEKGRVAIRKLLLRLLEEINENE